MRTGFKRLIFATVMSIAFFVLAASTSIERTYTYDTTDSTRTLSWSGSEDGGYSARVSVEIPDSRDSFFVSVPKTFDIVTGEELHAVFHGAGQDYEAALDTDGDERMLSERRYFLAPYWGKTAESLSIEFHADLSAEGLPSEFDIVMLDSRSFRYDVRFGPDILTARADDFFSRNGIVSRTEWGADEELRYEDSEVWKRIAERNAGYVPTAADKKASERRKAIDDYLAKEFSADYSLASIDRTEWGRPLVWPIQKTQYVKMITVHHTADSNTSDREDAEIVRSTYYYHAVVRGWGDIGYNYIIGQRGKIYEGRAGGDYSVAAHAVWNNRSSVGVSMIGNFEEFNVNAGQLAGLKSIVRALAGHYGIDLSASMSTHKECLSGQDCLMHDYTSTRLTGHRDIGYTTCPGKDLYKYVEQMRSEIDFSSGFTLVSNPDIREVAVASSSSPVASQTPTPTKPLAATNVGPDIRLKLSYPKDDILLSAYMPDEALVVSYGKKSGKLPKGRTYSITVSKWQLVMRVGKKLVRIPEGLRFSASVVRIDSWSRVPAWDTSGTYNDNLFRGTVELRMENGKLLVINELSMEDMLYGLAEISNDVPVEKAKAIIVSARSYANYYTDPDHRKFKNGEPYDGSDDPNVFQKYLGYGFESRSPKIREYVNATRGEVVTYQGEPIKTWYFTQSDGRTRSEREWCLANGGSDAACVDTPYLQSVPDPGSEGKTRLGHGVGMSGAGATYFAVEKGWDYESILKYFYTGVEVEKIY